jgi:transcriptional regulator with XRE-family HTH domain
LSLKAGLSPAVVGQIERGDVADPGTSTLSKLAAALEMTLDDLGSDGPAASGAAA